jgi:hypothetical protein
MDLMTTYTHGSELQEYVFASCSLAMASTVEILQLHMLRSVFTDTGIELPWTLKVTTKLPAYNISARTT